MVVVWGILDHNNGHSSQVKGALNTLKEKHGASVYEVDISKYSRSRIKTLFRKRFISKKIITFNVLPKPDIIVSCGSRTYRYVMIIKALLKPLKKIPKVVFLMPPGRSVHKGLDLVFYVKSWHRNLSSKANNVGLSYVISHLPEGEIYKYDLNIERPLISVVFPGSTKRNVLTNKVIKEAAFSIYKYVVKLEHSSVTILLGPRVTEKEKNMIIKHFAVYNINVTQFTSKEQAYSHYLYSLSISERVIQVGESLSMLADIKKAVSAFTKVYVYISLKFPDNRFFRYLEHNDVDMLEAGMEMVNEDLRSGRIYENDDVAVTASNHIMNLLDNKKK